ncbi:MAG TPA: hypothetical protein VFA90_18005 [Terriglobales bacterium]|nr:hypothetical protein [Terriglobales bacterium]
MTLAIVFAILGVLALVAIIYLAKSSTRHGNLDELAGQLRPVDVRAFRNLIDQSEEHFLRENLSFADFRSVHRERMLAAAEYVHCAAKNAAILVRLAEAARVSPEPEIVAAGERLLENALRLRLYAWQMIPRLYVAILLPGVVRGPHSLPENYDTIRRQVVMLGLRFPTHGMSSAL